MCKCSLIKCQVSHSLDSDSWLKWVAWPRIIDRAHNCIINSVAAICLPFPSLLLLLLSLVFVETVYRTRKLIYLKHRDLNCLCHCNKINFVDFSEKHDMNSSNISIWLNQANAIMKPQTILKRELYSAYTAYTKNNRPNMQAAYVYINTKSCTIMNIMHFWLGVYTHFVSSIPLTEVVIALLCCALQWRGCNC